jgi:hypothetical protein
LMNKIRFRVLSSLQRLQLCELQCLSQTAYLCSNLGWADIWWHWWYIVIRKTIFNLNFTNLNCAV